MACSCAKSTREFPIYAPKPRGPEVNWPYYFVLDPNDPLFGYYCCPDCTEGLQTIPTPLVGMGVFARLFQQFTQDALPAVTHAQWSIFRRMVTALNPPKAWTFNTRRSSSVKTRK